MSINRRTIAATLSGLLLPLAALAFMLAGITHEAPVGGWVGTDTAAAERPAAAPTWETHGGMNGCEPIREGVLSDRVLVVTQQGSVERVGFDAAWAVAHDSESANDVYVIGACR